MIPPDANISKSPGFEGDSSREETAPLVVVVVLLGGGLVCSRKVD
jgi:hypothetical protein